MRSQLNHHYLLNLTLLNVNQAFKVIHQKQVTNQQHLKQVLLFKFHYLLTMVKESELTQELEHIWKEFNNQLKIKR